MGGSWQDRKETLKAAAMGGADLLGDLERARELAAAPAAPLSSTEQFELHAHEQVIEQSLNAFKEVGAALVAIRDKRLYRAEYDTFEDYFQKRWGLGKSHAYRLMEASDVVARLSPIGDKLPENEAQARELAKLDNVDQVLAWKTIIETAPGGKITAGHVAAVADTLRELRETGALDLAGEVVMSASDAIQAKLTDETYERMQRQKEHIAESQNRKAHVANNSGEYEWYTPTALVEAARRTMGSIDCDPATSAIANTRIQAPVFYSLENSGLDFANTWTGNVWMNPPYALALVEPFIAKLLDQLRDGITTQACVLVNNATETEWFQMMLNRAEAICLLRGRVKFERPTGEAGSPLQGQTIIYFGEREVEFARAFVPYGKIVYVR